MDWKLTTEPLSLFVTDAIIVFHLQDCESTEGCTKEVNEALGYRISHLIMEGELTGSFGEVTILHNWGKIPSNRVLVCGLGKKEKLNLRRFKDVVAIVARKAKKIGLTQVGISYPAFLIKKYNSVDIVQAIIEGVELGIYEHESYRSSVKKNTIEKIWLSLDGIPLSAAEVGKERGKVFAQSTNLARWLVHKPANRLTPQQLAIHAKEVAEKRGLKIDILDETRLEELGMNALLTVGKGSVNPPRMIVFFYKGAPDNKEMLGFIGKGVTFDSGGLQIKPGPRMIDMKGDMAGAAAVIGAMDAIGSLQPHCNVMGVIVACENMVGRDAYRPGDVIDTFSGRTIEVLNTDAEGRIILADGISYALRLGATKLVDIATLTGAVITALGYETTGLMTNEATWGYAVKTAAGIVGEPVWELPLRDEYEQYIKSDIADLKNSAGSPGGSIQGGMFLSKFAENIPWVHLDIAGTAQANSEKGIHPKGATGIGVRTLTQLAIGSN